MTHGIRKEMDSLGEVAVPADRLWGAQTQRSLEHFSIGKDLIPREMITAYAILKKAAANANHADKRLDNQIYRSIVQVCDEILDGQHQDMFPLHVWMTGSGTQFNMNVNEVISNRCCQLAGTPLGSKKPVHLNDHVNMSHAWSGLFLPKGTPAAIVSRLNLATSEAMDTKAVQDRMHELGTTLVSPDRRSPEYFQMLVEREIAKWGPLITAAGISVD
jgi:fumarate hydratase class II